MSNKTVKVGFEIVDETGDINSVRKLTKDLQEMGYAIKEIEQLDKTSNAHDNAAKSADKHRESLDKLEQELGQATSALDELEASTEQVSDGLAELAQDGENTAASMESVRAGFAKVAASGTALALAAKGAITFESAMAGVKKTVEASDEQIEALGDRIKELSVETAQSAEDVATIAALGGQLGIAYSELEDFITLASKVGVAFNLSAEQAGESVAKLANVYQIPIQEIERLMDAVNTLGNNTAAKEAEIVEAMKRIGGTAKQFGLAAEEAAALSDAMIALGQTPETASTAIKALLRELNLAETQGEDFQNALGRIGLSAKQLAEDIRNNPQQALSEFLEKVSQLDKQVQTDVLTKLFQKEHAGTIGLITGSLDTYKKALELVNDETKKLGALNKEVDAQMRSTSARMKQARESIENLTSDIGNNLLPVIGDMADATRDTGLALSKFAQDYPNITKLATALAVAKVATMGLSVATGKQVTVSGLMNAQMLQTGLNAAAAAQGMNKATIATAAWTKATKAFRGALALISANPIFAAITAITVAVEAIDAIVESTEKWEKLIRDAHDALSDLQLKAADGIDIELNDETLKPVKDAIAEIDAELDNLSDDTGVFDFLSESLDLWGSNADKARELIAEKQELISRENELKKQIADRAAAEEAAAEKARAYAEEQKQVAAENLELLLARKAQLEELGETETAYYRQVISSLNKLNGEIDKGQNAARKALEQLGLSAGELQTGISKAAQQAIDDFSAAAKEFGKDTDSMSVIYKAALEKMNSPEAVAALNGQLESVAEKVGDISGAYKKIIASSMSASIASKKAFAELGVDVDGVMTGISSKAKQAMSNFSKAMEAAKNDGIDSMELTQKAVQKVLDTLNSKEEFAAFNSQLKEAEILSKTTAEQQKQIADGLKESTAAMSDSAKEVSENVKAQSEDMTAYQQSLTDAFNAGSLSLENYDKLMKQSKEATDESTESAKQKAEATSQQVEATKKSTEATEEDTSAAKANTQGQLAWTESAKNRIRTLEQLGLTADQTAQAVEAYQRRMDGGSVASFEQYLQKITGVTDEIIRNGEAFAETRNRAIEMTDVLSDNAASTEDLAMAQDALFRATEASIDGLVEMDQTTLDNLQNAIDETKNRLKEMGETARQEAEDLQAQLAKLRGDDDLSRQLEEKRKLAALEEKLAAARKRNNQEEIEAYQEAINYQKQIFAEKEKQYNEEKRQQAEREKSRNERKERREEPTQNGDGSGGSPFDVKLFANKFSQTVTSELNKADTIGLADSIARDTAVKVIEKIKEDQARMAR